MVTLKDKSMFFDYGFLKNIDRRIEEFDLLSAMRANEVIVMIVVPYMFVPNASGSQTFLNSSLAYNASLDENGQITVNRRKRDVVSLFFKEHQDVIGLEMSFCIANSFQ